MIQALVHKGRIEVQEAIPKEWEGLLVKIMPLTPEDPLPDLEQRLAALHALGPMEYESGEQEQIENSLRELNRVSLAAMQQIPR